MSVKNPTTPSVIEPATFRFVAQHLNHCATAVPRSSGLGQNIKIRLMQKYVNAYMFIFIALNNKNNSFAIIYRFVFLFDTFFSTFGVATKSYRPNVGSRPKKFEKHWSTSHASPS